MLFYFCFTNQHSIRLFRLQAMNSRQTVATQLCCYYFSFSMQCSRCLFLSLFECTWFLFSLWIFFRYFFAHFLTQRRFVEKAAPNGRRICFCFLFRLHWLHNGPTVKIPAKENNKNYRIGKQPNKICMILISSVERLAKLNDESSMYIASMTSNLGQNAKVKSTLFLSTPRRNC